MKWIAMKFGTDSHVSLGLNCNNLGDHWKRNSRFYTSKSVYRFLWLQSKSPDEFESEEQSGGAEVETTYETSVAHCSFLFKGGSRAITGKPFSQVIVGDISLGVFPTS